MKHGNVGQTTAICLYIHKGNAKFFIYLSTQKQIFSLAKVCSSFCKWIYWTILAHGYWPIPETLVGAELSRANLISTPALTHLLKTNSPKCLASLNLLRTPPFLSCTVPAFALCYVSPEHSKWPYCLVWPLECLTVLYKCVLLVQGAHYMFIR